METTSKQEAASRPTYSNIIPRKIRVIGIPLDLGQSRRGVDMGPSAVRVAGLEARLEALGHIVEDAGNVAVAIAEQKKEGDPHAKYLKEITATCTKHAELVLKTLEAGKVPVVLGGDCRAWTRRTREHFQLLTQSKSRKLRGGRRARH